MTEEQLLDFVEQYEKKERETEEYISSREFFEKMENKLSQRRDLHIMLMLDKLCPDNNDIVSWSEHDEFHFGISIEELAKVVTESQLNELLGCGLSVENDGLHLMT